jgi:hypothetical protein
MKPDYIKVLNCLRLSAGIFLSAMALIAFVGVLTGHPFHLLTTSAYAYFAWTVLKKK